jgi:hypothetical protein
MSTADPFVRECNRIIKRAIPATIGAAPASQKAPLALIEMMVSVA